MRFTPFNPKVAILYCVAIFLTSSISKAQLTGIKNIPGDYATLSAAITALNTSGVGAGGVTLNVIAGNAQTAPSGGYSIGGAGSAILTGGTATSSTKQVTIQGNSNTITASASQTSGSIHDGIFKLIGADWITITGFTMQENSSNTTTDTTSNNMTEWGVAFLHVSTTDGAKNNTVKSCAISLNKTYANTFGIYSNDRHSATNCGTVNEITDTSGSNNWNKIYANTISNVNFGVTFIGSGNASYMDYGNDIGGSSSSNGNTVTNWGGLAAASKFVSNSTTSYCILMNHQRSDNVSYNTITSASVTPTVTFRGIVHDYSTNTPTGTFTSTISNNTITMTSGQTSGTFRVIDAMSGVNSQTMNITYNTIQNCSISGNNSSSLFGGIFNNGAISVLNISHNVFKGNTSSATSGGFTGISNTGAVTTSMNFDYNEIGNSSGNAITFSANNSGAFTGISSAINLTANLSSSFSTSYNNFQGITYSTSSSCANTYINSTFSGGFNFTGTSNVDYNTFTNLSIATNGSITFITSSAPRSGSSANSISYNSIVTGFNKSVAGGTVKFLSSTGATSSSSVTITSLGNNFSNVTVTGATTVNGWFMNEGSSANGPTKTTSNNTFSNITGGTQVIVVMDVSYGLNGIVSGNIINTASTNDQVIGIRSLGGSQTISGNTINSFYATEKDHASSGILVTDVTNELVYQNKIYDMENTYNGTNNTTCIVNGIIVAASSSNTSARIYNNLIGDLRVPDGGGSMVISGIQVVNSSASNTLAVNVCYNTVYVNGTSTKANFGTSALYVATSTNTIDTCLDNIFVNTSKLNSSGFNSVIRYETTPGTSYSSASNNNLLYAGTASANQLLYGEGTSNNPNNGQQTLAAYKTYVGPTADTKTISEQPHFISTTGTSAYFLHIDCSFTNHIESGGVNVYGITNDYDGQTRQGNAGYVGTGTAPDIGADEFDCTLLPIVLVSFNAALMNDLVNLSWSTMSEENTDYFAIERSTNGTDFTEIGTEKAANVSTEELNYSFEDNSAQELGASQCYYRLRMVDLDGSYKYSDVRLVVLGATGVKTITVVPNPFHESAVVSYSEFAGSEITCELYNSFGKLMDTYTSSSGAITIKRENLPQGIYFLRVISHGAPVANSRIVIE